jgi:7-keto-8-aminopelargonate synthetase-like enzyme
MVATSVTSLLSTASGTIPLFNQLPENSSDNSILFVVIGSGITFIATVIANYLNLRHSHQLSKQRTIEAFKLKLLELKIGAAQKSFQYLYKLHREFSINGKSSKCTQLSMEARDWLDGEALLLGQDAYQAVLGYINILCDEKSDNEMELGALDFAENRLRDILTKDIT